LAYNNIDMAISTFSLIQFALSLLLITLWGIGVVRKNILLVLIILELFILSINLLFIFTSVIHDDILGQVIALLVLSVAGAEAAIGLAILIAYFRIKSEISLDTLNALKG
jgi:NADH:ubiquinone oxidoreductase subunit K